MIKKKKDLVDIRNIESKVKERKRGAKENYYDYEDETNQNGRTNIGEDIV